MRAVTVTWSDLDVVGERLTSRAASRSDGDGGGSGSGRVGGRGGAGGGQTGQVDRLSWQNISKLFRENISRCSPWLLPPDFFTLVMVIAAGSDSSISISSVSGSTRAPPIWFFTFILLKFFSFKVPLFFSCCSGVALDSLDWVTGVTDLGP